MKDVAKKLQRDRNQLISAFLKSKGVEFIRKHARLFDDYFCTGYELSDVGPRMDLKNNPYAVVAQGGYGRAEQCLFSDIDLLFLFRNTVPDEAEDLVREVVYPLWDLGLEVGHTTLALQECLNRAAEDYEVLLPLLDARFICGMSPLYSELMGALKQKIIRPRTEKILRWLIRQSESRRTHFGDSAYLLEPNLKQGQGGLRDYHTMLWVAKIDGDLKEPRDLEFDGYLSREEFDRLIDAVEFIWEVRNRLHKLAGRKCDQLYFEQQVELADQLKYRPKGGQQPVERFLGDLHARMEFLKQQHLIFLHEVEATRLRKRRGKHVRRVSFKGIKVEKEMLNFSSAGEIIANPNLLVAIYTESARLKIPLNAEAKRLVKEFLYLINAAFRKNPEVLALFEKILVTPAPKYNVLNDMLNTGILCRLIPEMKKIVNIIQYDEYHLYPVDKHSLRTVQSLKNFASSKEDLYNPLCGKLYKDLKNKRLLLWAAMLHDIGKGFSKGDHSELGSELARKLLQNKRLDSDEIETVVFLIKEHLFLIKTATRRDIHDEETAIFCARKIKQINRLKMLYLLTVADCMSTGPKAWNEWTSTLLRDLFLRVMSILEKGELASREAVEKIEAKKAEILGMAVNENARRQMGELFNFMSPRYLLYTPLAEIRKHVGLFQQIGTADFVWQVVKGPEPNTRQITICAKDRPGLFSKIAGVFTLNRLNILDVKVYTWRNNIALDVFKLKPPADQLFEDEKWDRAKENLVSALAGDLDLAQELRKMGPADHKAALQATAVMPPKIVVDNESSSFFTIVEVFAYDFPGLLFRITDALFRCRLDVWFAKIATRVDQIVDVFYVRDFDGQKIDSADQVEAIKKEIAVILPVAAEKEERR